jgi:hypothetical protein
VECGRGTQHTTTCEKYQEWKAANADADALTGGYLNSLGSGRLRCPGCRRDFEKDGGCNHITCPCKTHYCCICGDMLSATRPYDHFQPGNPAARTPACPLFPGQEESEGEDEPPGQDENVEREDEEDEGGRVDGEEEDEDDKDDEEDEDEDDDGDEEDEQS